MNDMGKCNRKSNNNKSKTRFRFRETDLPMQRKLKSMSRKLGKDQNLKIGCL